MRNIILGVLILITFSSNAQKLELGLSAGTGKTYIFESSDKSLEVNYGLPVSFISDLKFTPINSNWGVKIQLHYIESALYGINWLPGMMQETLDGFVATWSGFLLFENEIIKPRTSFGFNFGLGFTKESVQIDTYDDWNRFKSTFPTLAFGGHLTFKLNNNFDFQILPVFLLQDPYRTIGYLKGTFEPAIAREDLSILLNFGLRYNLLKNVKLP